MHFQMRNLLFILSLAFASCDHKAKRVTVDLSVDPEHRWDNIAAEQKDVFVKAMNTIFANPAIAKFVPVAKALLGNPLEARRLLTEEQYGEAKGIARVMGIETSEIVLVGAFYDLFAAGDSPLASKACTGIVAQSSAGEITHGRNLDYDFVKDLANNVLAVDFVRNGTIVFTGVTMGPNPLFNTGVRYGAFSLSHDERDSGRMVDNVFDMLVRGRTATFAAIRQAMETVESFEEAVKFFSTEKLSASSYFILGGTKKNEGAVITRGRDEALDVWRLNAAVGAWYVMETNYDHWKLPGARDNRRVVIQRAMNTTGAANISPTTMWDVISVTQANRSAGERAPFNAMTVYSTVMQAAGKPEDFTTVVRDHTVVDVRTVV